MIPSTLSSGLLWVIGIVGLPGIIALVVWRLNRHLDRQLAETAKKNAHQEAVIHDLKSRLATGCDGQGPEPPNVKKNDLQNLLDHLPVPVWLRDMGLVLTFCNRSYDAAVGVPPGEAVTDGLEIVPADDGKVLAKRVRDTCVSQSHSAPIVIDQRRRLVEFTETPLLDTSGKCCGIMGWARDCTDIESVRGDLEQHTQAHERVLENLRIAIAIFGPDKRLTFFNGSYVRMWGLDKEWLYDKPEIGEILDQLYKKRRLPDVIDFQAFKEQQRALFTALTQTAEDWLYLPDGTTVFATMAPHPLGGILFTYEDVTDRLVLQRSYHTLNAAQRETLNNLYEGISVFGADGRLKLNNPAFAAIWKLPLELLKKNPHVSVLAEQCEAHFSHKRGYEVLRKLLVEGVATPVCREDKLLRKDGSIIDCASVPLPDGSVLFTYRDVTDQARVEQALRERAEAMEASSRVKSEFIANMSYELLTPLNSIMGFTEMLGRQYAGKLTAQQMEYTRGIADASHQLTLLIDDILDMAQIEAGHINLKTKNVSLKTFFRNFLPHFEKKAKTRQINLTVHVASGLPNIDVDPRRLEQAVSNLLNNALHFTSPGGQVALSAARRSKQVHIAIEDDGVGIAREDQRRILEPFEKVGNDSRSSGLGLRLPMVKALVELHGGRLILRSHVNRGTRVTMVFPAAGKSGKRPAPTKPPSKRRRIHGKARKSGANRG